MARSTFSQPLPRLLADDLAVGYAYVNGAYQPQGREWAQLAQAAGLSATATDMARFMIAHLQHGRLGNTRILRESTATAMQQQTFTNDARVNGLAHGFSEATVNGRHLLWHGGDILNFHSALILLPEHNTGFFVSFNGANGLAAVLNTLRAVMDHYYPGRQPVPETPAGRDDVAANYEGIYLPTRAEYTTAGKLVRLLQSIRVTSGGPGELAVSLGFPGRATAHYLEVAPGVFRSTGVPPSIFGDVVFRGDGPEGAQYLFQQNNPTTAYTKAPWYAEPGFNLALLSLIILLFLSVIVWTPVTLGIRRRDWKNVPLRHRLAFWWQASLSLSGLLFLLGFALVFSNPQVVFGLSSGARALFLVPAAIAILEIGMIAITVMAWTRRWWRLPVRLHYTLVTLAGLAFVCWLVYWNLWIGYLR